MRSPVVVVGFVLPQHGADVPLVDDDQVIQALSAECAYYSFGDGVRLGSSDRGEYGFDAQPSCPWIGQRALRGEDLEVPPDGVAESFQEVLVGSGSPYLLIDPNCRLDVRELLSHPFQHLAYSVVGDIFATELLTDFGQYRIAAGQLRLSSSDAGCQRLDVNIPQLIASAGHPPIFRLDLPELNREQPAMPQSQRGHLRLEEEGELTDVTVNTIDELDQAVELPHLVAVQAVPLRRVVGLAVLPVAENEERPLPDGQPRVDA